MISRERALMILRVKGNIRDLRAKIEDVRDAKHTLLSSNGLAMLRESLREQEELIARLEREERT